MHTYKSVGNTAVDQRVTNSFFGIQKRVILVPRPRSTIRANRSQISFSPLAIFKVSSSHLFVLHFSVSVRLERFLNGEVRKKKEMLQFSRGKPTLEYLITRTRGIRNR